MIGTGKPFFLLLYQSSGILFDAAFLRRIKYHIQFHLPNESIREQLWRTYIPSKMPCQVDYALLARNFPGISGSDIANAVFSAAVGAARDGETIVLQKRFEDAIQRGIDVKKANQNGQLTISKRTVSEDEVKDKLKIGGI